MTTCCIYDCDNPVKSRNLCSKHYQRQIRHGDTGINYKSRINRVFVNDISTYIRSSRTYFEEQVLNELFCLGRHQGCLAPNYGEAWSHGTYDTVFESF